MILIYAIMRKERRLYMKVSVGVSNRHVHLTEEHFHLLFDKVCIEPLKPIHQPNQFSSTDVVTIETEKGSIANVRVMGPNRDYTQVEISKTDAYKLGLNPPIRDSGDIHDSSAVTIIGPKGRVYLEQGCIIANRHIHITPKQMELYGLLGFTEVHIQVGGEKGGILNHVYLKVDENSYFELHLDMDDANAFGLQNGDIVTILEGNLNDI